MPGTHTASAIQNNKVITEQETAPQLDILYHDKYLVAVNKPAGMLVHRSWLDKHATRFVMQTLRDQIGQHVFPIHRLDRPTSGVLLFALNAETARLLAQQFEQKQVEKKYVAIVRGYINGSDTIDYPLKVKLDKIADKFANQEKPPQEAITHYRALQQLELPIAVGRYATARYTLMELTPHTGRKHQLRRHMKHIFHPIIGDSCYGDLHQNRAFAEKSGYSRLLLHAKSLKIHHPYINMQIKIDSPFDEAWLNIFNNYQWNNIN